MTTQGVEDKPHDTPSERDECEYAAVAAVWTDQKQDGTIRTTIQWDLTDQGVPPKKADELCNLHTTQLLANIGRSLLLSDLRS
jgi:hypothetical protein